MFQMHSRLSDFIFVRHCTSRGAGAVVKSEVSRLAARRRFPSSHRMGRTDATLAHRMGEGLGVNSPAFQRREMRP